jgi:ferric-dicitrate binding protein FerR (iron transport regulator)
VKNDRRNEPAPELETRWRRWAESEPSIDEQQLRRNLLERIPDHRPRMRGRLLWVAAVASLLALVIGIESLRRPQPSFVSGEAVVHETGANVILVLREGSEPIYFATGTSTTRNGEER